MKWVGIVSLVALFGVLLAACGSGGSDTTGGTEGEASSGSGETINLLTWETYDEPEWLKEFEEETGITVNSTNVGSPAEMFSKVKANPGQYDIVLNTAGWFPQYVEADLLEPIDESKVPKMKNIKLGFTGEEATSVDGKLYGVLYNWGNQPMAWIPEKVKGLEPLKVRERQRRTRRLERPLGSGSEGQSLDLRRPDLGRADDRAGARVQEPLPPRRRGIRRVRKETARTAAAGQTPDQRLSTIRRRSWPTGEAGGAYLNNIAIATAPEGRRHNAADVNNTRQAGHARLERQPARSPKRAARTSSTPSTSSSTHSLTPAWQARFIANSGNSGTLNYEQATTPEAKKAGPDADAKLEETLIPATRAGDEVLRSDDVLPAGRGPARGASNVWNEFKLGLG